MERPVIKQEAPSTPPRQSKLKSVIWISPGSSPSTIPTPGGGETATPTQSERVFLGPTPTPKSQNIFLGPTPMQETRPLFAGQGSHGGNVIVSSPWKKMYAGVVVPDEPDVYSETQFSSDLIDPSELHNHRTYYEAKIRLWSPYYRDEGRWACRANCYEKHWFYLDEVIKGGDMFVPGVAKELPITKMGPLRLTMDHPARDAEWCQADVIAYLRSMMDTTDGNHSQMNRIQGEFKYLWDDMHRVMSHLPIAHVYSDLDTVEELLKAAQEYLHEYDLQLL
ncbi:hypothetical protein M422DRAFT_263555 [Sphaerobolus stellatus SS14]|uniref:Uncharacterized protein n=1 Tax=Sphaerobolus stellatus (strain SS14) TaxID=990650 RepID=A0A0C9UYT2_SPHS4|nr:hypothetical protein M422DRAFT_263555 [Sphaerobolus stellatus SS14]